MKNLSKYTRSIIVAVAALLLVTVVVFGANAITEKPADTPSADRTEAADGTTDSKVTPAPRIRGTWKKAEMSDATKSSVPLPPVKGVEEAQLTYAPEVPPAITRSHASRVVVHMEVIETVKELSDGVQYTFWTFGGETPGPMIRVREGDLIEFHLQNDPSSKLPHNIDLHSVTGTGGGAEATLVVPGKQAMFEFRALNPGLYVYHCATAPVGLHIANGMYGLILVEPKEGLPEVDREYYVMQSEFYTEGKFNEKGLQEFDFAKAVEENPDYVVFNGGVGALTGDGALEAAVGETVRLYVGNGGPNLTSSFHVIGEIFDRVYGEAGSKANQTNVQTTAIPAGGATVVEFSVDTPGKYTLVDHAIFRAFNKGAVGILNVIGHESTEIYSDRLELNDYAPAN